MKTKNFFKTIGIMTALIMLLQVVSPLTLIIPVSFAEEETILETWDASSTEEDNVTAYMIQKEDSLILKLTGTGKMKDYWMQAEIPWWFARYSTSITDIIIENGITHIGDLAFYGCSKIETLVLPNSITSIGYGSISGCSGLTSVTLSQNLKEIEGNAFAGCKKLEKMTVPRTVETVGDTAFATSRPGKTNVYYYADCTAMAEYAEGEFKNEANFIVIKAESIEIQNPDEIKTTYKEGTALNLDNLKLIVTYNNGDIARDVTEFTSDPINGSTLTELGPQTVIITHDGISTNLDITVVEKIIQSITIIEEPQTEYYEGQELDLTGMVIEVLYDDGTTEEITVGYETDVPNGTALTTIGEQTIKVTYGGATTNLGITVIEKAVQSMTIKEKPKTNYIVGENLDLTGLVLEVTYNDGTTEEVTEGYETSIANGGKLNTAGNQTIVVTYEGMTADLGITVSQKVVESIAIVAEPQTEYYVGDELDLTGLVLEVTYSDGTTEEITSGYETSIANGAKLNEDGTQTITVTYNGKAATFDIVVLKKVADKPNVDSLPQTGKPDITAIVTLLIAIAAISYMGIEKYKMI